MNDHYDDLADMLAQEARLFAARSEREGNSKGSPTTLIVADFEYRWDRPSHARYAAAECKLPERVTFRWPFYHIAAISWLVLRIAPGEEVATVAELVIHAEDEMTEPQMAAAFFDALDRHSDALLITWGGEAKDCAVLRRCAAETGLRLPRQLVNGSPNARERLDLCRAVSVQAASVHLPEYCHALSIPAKPWPSESIGRLVESGKWAAVREQVLADVLATTVVGLWHLQSHGAISIHRERSIMAIAESAAKKLPASRFVTQTFRLWAEAGLRAASLRGVVFRAA